MNLQESIRKVLREETGTKKTDLVKKMIYLWLSIILFIVPTIIKDRREYQEWSKK